MGNLPAIVVFVISVYSYLPKKFSSPLQPLYGYILHLFVAVSVNTVIIFVTFATPKVWIQQLNSEDGYDGLTQEF